MASLSEKLNGFFTIKGFNIIAFVLIAGLVLVAYSNTFHSSFHFDDNPSIVDNPNIKYMNADSIMSLLKAGVRPVVYISLMINYKLGGMDPFGYHVFNIGIHIITSFLVYLLISWTVSLPVFKGKYADRAKRMGLFGGLLFALHPIQTESVTYIISRTELLATVFYVAAFLMFVYGIQKRDPIYYVGGFVSALLSAMSKEWAVTLPAMIMLYDYMFLSDRKMSAVLSHWLVYLLSAIQWVIILNNLNLFTNTSVGFNMVSSSGGTTPPSLTTYLLTSFNVLWTYIRLLIVPFHQNLDYEYPIAKTLFEFPTLISFLGHIAVVYAAFWLFKKKGWLLIPFGIAWFYIGISPVHSIVPVMDIIFEHRMYMPSIGFFIIFVAAFESVVDWWQEKKAEQSKTTPA